jgi:hypothetical protein
MHILFANTGIQIVCVTLRGRYASVQTGYGWQRCRCGGEGAASHEYPYIQWQIIQTGSARLFLAVDTTCGDPEIGYFCAAESLVRDHEIRVENLLDVRGQPLRGLPVVELCIRPATATAGDAKHVHMVVDFGNSRTGALLLEMVGEIAQAPQMMPFELNNRYHMDAWNDAGEPLSLPGSRWFSSKTHWCNTPYLPPVPCTKIEYRPAGAKEAGWFGRDKKPKTSKVEVEVVPPLFDDLSMVRLGSEADDLLQVMRAEGDIRTGVSSPKRYLWADDASWLEGANWYMADPADRCGTGLYAALLHGPLLRYIHEDDRDFLLDGEPKPEQLAPEAPLKPRHAPRAMMTAALYEMLCQAYAYVNSAAYRGASGDAGRTREIRTLSLTFPSGMIQEEQRRLAAQAQKAIDIFARSLGKGQRVRPELNLNIDEASAVHLTYIWSEMRMLGQDPRLWFSTLHQDRGRRPAPPPPDEPAAPLSAAPAGRRRGPIAPPPRPGRPGRAVPAPKPNGGLEHAIRIACIDIGGGTTDLMIAEYTFESHIDDVIRGRVLHQDGICLGGDQLVKRLLETIIVPAMADTLGFEEEDVQLLFGPEVPWNREMRWQRVAWINRLFVPLAQAYLDCAADEIADQPISHTDPALVDPVVVESLQKACDKLRGPGYYNVQQELGVVFDRAEFEKVAYDVFDELLFDFCRRIVEHEADVVLLAGLPSKLGFIQRLIETYVPLASSRIVPMHNHYAGNWYPYQDQQGRNPGVIVDPKSPVVVGAAIEFLARHGMLPQFKFEMKGRACENSYYWGVMTDASSGIRNERILFQTAEDQAREEITEFSTIAQRVLIGRKLSREETAQATPVYLLKMDVGDRIGQTEVQVKIKRRRATKESEETLEVESVTGIVAGEGAILDENVHFSWRTLADERYYLDTGGLDRIELGARQEGAVR